MLGRLAATLLCLALLAGAGAAAPPRVRVSAPPAAAWPGTVWEVVVTAGAGRPRAFVLATAGRTRTLPVRLVGKRFRARVVFIDSGRTRYGVRLGKRTVWAGSITVLPPLLQQPFGVLEEPAGTLLVADWKSSAIFRLDPARHRGSLVANVEAARDLKRAANGKLLVTSGPTVVELDPATGAQRTLGSAGAAAEGVAEAPDGTLYVSVQSSVVAIAPDRSRRVVAGGLNGVHGLLFTDRGVIACESFGGRVLLISPTGTEVLAAGLANPSYAAPAGGDGLYVSEFTGNRVSRLDADGKVSPVASVPMPGPLALDRAGRLLVGSLTGSIYRVTPESGAVERLYP